MRKRIHTKDRLWYWSNDQWIPAFTPDGRKWFDGYDWLDVPVRFTPPQAEPPPLLEPIFGPWRTLGVTLVAVALAARLGGPLLAVIALTNVPILALIHNMHTKQGIKSRFSRDGITPVALIYNRMTPLSSPGNRTLMRIQGTRPWLGFFLILSSMIKFDTDESLRKEDVFAYLEGISNSLIINAAIAAASALVVGVILTLSGQTVRWAPLLQALGTLVFVAGLTVGSAHVFAALLPEPSDVPPSAGMIIAMILVVPAFFTLEFSVIYSCCLGLYHSCRASDVNPYLGGCVGISVAVGTLVTWMALGADAVVSSAPRPAGLALSVGGPILAAALSCLELTLVRRARRIPGQYSPSERPSAF
jgi:hypothetical protein